MGRLRFEGPGAAVFLAELLTRRVADMELGQIRYSLVTNDEGGILDDVLVGYYQDSYGQPFYVMVVNASNREKIVDWIHAASAPRTGRNSRPRGDLHRPEPAVGHVRRARTQEHRGFATAGQHRPAVDAILPRRADPTAASGSRRQGGIVSRTGYTGEDGFELSVAPKLPQPFGRRLWTRASRSASCPAAWRRDTLRLEAAMPLYGHELSEANQSLRGRAGLRLHLDGYDFPGRDALLRMQKEPLCRVRVGLEMAGQRRAATRPSDPSATASGWAR